MSSKNLKFNSRGEQRGFVALLSTIILTIILMIVIFSTSMSTFFARFDSMGNENKKVSKALADACINAALLKIAQNYNYAGNEIVTVDTSKSCSVETVVYTAVDSSTAMTIKKLATIKTSAEYPSINGSWSTSTVTAVVNNPSNAASSPSQAIPITIQTWD